MQPIDKSINRPKSAQMSSSPSLGSEPSNGKNTSHHNNNNNTNVNWIKKIRGQPSLSKITKLNNMITTLTEKDEKVFSGFKVNLKTNLNNLDKLVTATADFETNFEESLQKAIDETKWLDDF
ncbi:hypothetical protein CANARDRAFT_211469 [[Candida] arabinofermentans NRRL YB-2248]|uniref:Uncharacterized protein n=1 Tax=[Candida] arabinofermentans NRRL YB-2248 TaxID=983967 RepID=A0A1E4T5E0_9ASCO|nr:hypothetical protein CANARDRAFT_211469 [[Candida] arabinofermentans NRRL YB-2248]